ncbi:Zinc finger protein [Plakobranchus ocellatus]|uniref:Zinc finger protein n=1 Tax=Plakobranchus ocellatus TaxID=259542 RepID=A0AAV4A4G7_9GAST|nr:Zinc finger protein [Plakobranchus ocellatus]
MATMEEIVKQADLLGYRGEKREEYLKQEFKLLTERQEKKEEAERQTREKKEEAERQERKEEAERQAREKKEEAERQAREKKEEADRKERLELEKMKLDAEMKLLQAKIEAGIIKNDPDGNGARLNDAGAKHPKLPNFQDGRDDLDIWLTRFERFAESNGWSREKWSSSLCALLTGRAVDCYGRLSAEQAKDYDKVKEALMKRYDLTEDGYRRKFRTCKPAEGESPDMFIVRIVTYLDRWIELSKIDKSYEKLKDLIVREKFMDDSLGRGAIVLQDENVEKVRHAPRPKTKREVRAFLRLVGYYKEFVPNFAAVSAPLSDLVRKGQPNIVNWGDSQERAYNSLKVAMTSKPVLQLPDVNKRFVLRTDASNRGLGAALMQENEGTLFPVAYASKKLTDRERKYSVTERESLAIVWGVKKFSLYLYGTVFTLQTDHGALQFLNAAKFDSPRIMRWTLALQVYSFDAQYIKGSENVGAVYLSRIE